MLRATATCLALAAVLAFGGAASAASPQGNAKGVKLLKRVQMAYRHVPAVQLTGRSGQIRSRFLLWLRKGVATAESYRGTTPAGVTVLVAHGSGPTYAREPGSSCWRRLRPSDPQTLTDLGKAFPGAGGMTLEAPRRSGGYWLLPVTQGGHHGTMRISAKTFLLKSFTAATSSGKVTELDRALTRQPALPKPSPRC